MTALPTTSAVGAKRAGRESADAEFLRRLGKRIRLVRVDRGLSQEQLAGTAGMSRNFVSSIERGAHGVDVVRLRWLAMALDVPLTVLIEASTDAVAAALSTSAERG